MTEEVNDLYIPVKTGFESDNNYHRRNYRSIENYLESPHINSAKVISLSADKLTAGTISSTLLVTGLIQAPAATGYRVEIGDATYPLRYWNGTTTRLYVDTSGNVVITGAINATSGTITGTLDVSGLIRAPASGYRIEIGDATYPLRYWDGATTKFAVDASGGLVLTGTISSSGGLPILRQNGYSRCKIRNGSGDSISDDTETTMTWSTEDSDTDSYWSGGTSVTMPFTGQYLIIAQASFAADSNNRRYIRLEYSNGNPLPGASFASAAAIGVERTTCLITDVFDLTAADTLRVRVYQNCGGPLNTSARLAIVYLGPD